MAVSRRLRFEILRRDQHCCRYCGEHASPQVKLTVDHVLPVALGGTDEPANLAAACQPCNAGKAATSPDAEVVAQVSDDAMRWRQAMAIAAKRQLEKQSEAEQYVRSFLSNWELWNESLSLLPDDWQTMVTYWWSIGVPVELAQRATDIAMRKKISGFKVFRYMIGVMKNFIADMESDATKLLAAD